MLTACKSNNNDLLLNYTQALEAQRITDRLPELRGVQSVKVELAETFLSPKKLNNDLIAEINEWLQIAGMNESDSINTLEIKINVKGKPIFSHYSREGLSYREICTSAQVEGKISFKLGENTIIEKTFQGATEPPSSILIDEAKPLIYSVDEMIENAESEFIIPAFFQCYYRAFGITPFVLAIIDKNDGDLEASKANPQWYCTESAIFCLPLFLYSVNPVGDPYGSSRAIDAIELISQNIKSSEAAKKNLRIFIFALNNENPLIRANAAKILGRIEDQEALVPLISSLNNKYETGDEIEAVKASVVALGNLQNSIAVKPLLRSLKNKYGIQTEAAEAIGKIADPKSVSPLIKMLHQKRTTAMDYERSDAALKALVIVTKKDFGDNYQEWKEWWQKNKPKNN